LKQLHLFNNMSDNQVWKCGRVDSPMAPPDAVVMMLPPLTHFCDVRQGAEFIAKVLSRAPLMEDFKMASSRVGPKGGSALALGLTAGTSEAWECRGSRAKCGPDEVL
jgi:hypothetical protein